MVLLGNKLKETGLLDKKGGIMSSVPDLKFKIASEASEFEQIYRLNYKTFVSEIPQHEPNQAEVLVDQFDDENDYLICLRDSELLGMMAVRDKRPFSLDRKLKNLDSYLPPERKICEFRLLAVEGDYRTGRIFYGLAEQLAHYCQQRGYTLAIMSGTLRQQKLYKHIGFVPFGPLVGTAEAQFQPMYLTLEIAMEKFGSFFQDRPTSTPKKKPVNLLPGPVEIKPEVRKVLAENPISHRARTFVNNFKQTKQNLCQLVNSQYVEMLLGSGTLANDVVAGQLSLLEGPGLILSSGEFGDRLINHAIRAGLSFETLSVEWGDILKRDDIIAALDRRPHTTWLWAVHCETSSGVLNDLAMLKEICTPRNIRLCLDCVSTIGAVPVDLEGVYLATGTSGKCLAAFPGLALVFYNHPVDPAPEALPRYLDLGLYAAKNGVPFTTSSNLLYALHKALQLLEPEQRFQHIADISAWLRPELRERGFQLVVDDAHTSPAVITIVLPEQISSEYVGDQLVEAGFLLSYQSEYLLKRNWIQICLMGECSRNEIAPILEVLPKICSYV